LPDSTQNKRDATNSLVIMLCTLLSRLLGILRARVMSSVFGATATADVINFTFNIPNNFRKLFAEGAANSALIPTFSSLLGRGEDVRSRRLFALLCTYQSILLLPLILLSYIFAEPIIAFLSDFEAEQVRLGGRLLPFFMVYLGAISLSAIFNGVLQAHQKFVTAYLSPLLFSITVIVGVLLTSDSLGAMSMAWAALLGGILQGSYSYLMLRKFGYRMKVALQVGQTPMVSVAKAWVLVLLGMGMQVLTQLISFHFASRLEAGSVTAFSNSTIFYQTPYGIFFNAISAVSLPLMSRCASLGQHDTLRLYVRNALKNLLALLLPSTIILFFLSEECVAVVFQSGNYTFEDVQRTALVLRPYLIFMSTTAWYAMLLRLGYSTNRYAMMTIIAVVQNLIDIILMWIFLQQGYGLISLSLANGISYCIGLILLILLLKDVYPIYRDKQLYAGCLRILLANIPLFLYCFLYSSLALQWHVAGSTLKGLLYLCLIGSTAVLILLFSYHLFRIDIFRALFNKKQGGNLKSN